MKESLRLKKTFKTIYRPCHGNDKPAQLCGEESCRVADGKNYCQRHFNQLNEASKASPSGTGGAAC